MIYKSINMEFINYAEIKLVVPKLSFELAYIQQNIANIYSTFIRSFYFFLAIELATPKNSSVIIFRTGGHSFS